MSKQVFINLPVTDLKKSMSFYETIGFKNNPQFSDDTSACMVVNDTIFVMLLTHEKFQQFTSKPIIDAKSTVGVLNSLSMSSNDELNNFVASALKAGGREYREPQDFGFMQLRCFEDLDGHNWEATYVDMSKMPAQ
ncbi:glyoxalase/bleomycin resistance/extradiol dioxygenase family protein [Parasegetibacter sp. MAH-26]|uniref:Glyoxalase/bleomycin resistance/extradiol dioxygenase family protein n=2 Tax=Pinibacter aurantiacus TaxID=2851599 RepID=A0A9E2S9I3_9BACT|nr:glyoxalase/bleomycin resistance/extradiol dioxygenase family protein [Pinibacter aurantiacus]